VTALAIAREALERIAEAGIVVDIFGMLDDPECPEHEDFGDCDCGEKQCGECGHLQVPAGPCLNRDCLTAIARAALDDMRRAS